MRVKTFIDSFKNAVITIIRNWIDCLGKKMNEKYEVLISNRINFLNQNMLALQEEIEDMEDIKFIVDEFQIIKQRCITIDLEIPVIEVSS